MKQIIDQLKPLPSKRYCIALVIPDYLLSQTSQVVRQIPIEKLTWRVKLGVYYEPALLRIYVQSKVYDASKE